MEGEPLYPTELICWALTVYENQQCHLCHIGKKDTDECNYNHNVCEHCPDQSSEWKTAQSSHSFNISISATIRHYKLKGKLFLRKRKRSIHIYIYTYIIKGTLKWQRRISFSTNVSTNPVYLHHFKCVSEQV